MEAPIIVECRANFSVPPVDQETGFPFDDNYDWEDRLNNIAERHPEFADHLRFDDFPSLRRKRNGSGSSSSTDQETNRFGVGPSSRFGGLNSRFPTFSRNFEDKFSSESPQKNRQEKPPEVPKSEEKRGRRPNPNLPQHLSNTVDLGQKQPPEEVRSQRSMSAPPENRSTQGSRVDSDVPDDRDMGKSQSRPSEPAPPQPKERIIPIQVEGRSEPVFPKNTHTHHANSAQPPPPPSSSSSSEQGFGGERFAGYQQPSFPRGPDAFGQQKRQQAYEQYMPHTQTRQQQQPPQQPGFTKQQTPPQQQQYYQQQAPQQHYQPAPPPQHHQQQQYQSSTASSGPQQQYYQQQQHKQATPPPESRAHQQARSQGTPPPSNDPLDKIKIVKNDVLELMTLVQNFQGTRKDREYLYLDEMLTRNLIKLDDVVTDGKDNIRSARKEAIKCIQTCISNLEAKAQAREKELKAAGGDQQISQTPQDQTNQSATVDGGEVQKPQEQQQHASTAPIFKTEATINISGSPQPTETSANQEQSSQEPSTQEPMEVDQKPEAVNNAPSDAATASSVENVTSTEQQSESKSSQPDSTSK